MNNNGTEDYKKVLIWKGWFRLSHWSLAVSTLVLLTTGWLISSSPYLHDPSQAWHNIAAGLFVFGLLLRITLFLTGTNQERLSALIPGKDDFTAIKAMLLFYLTLGKSPLPGWYAQNPLWKSVYLLFYIVCLFLAISGLMLPGQAHIAGFFLSDIHLFWSHSLFWFCLLHLGAITLHDARAKKYDISAMLHGYKLYLVDRSGSKPEIPVQKITIDSIRQGTSD